MQTVGADNLGRNCLDYNLRIQRRGSRVTELKLAPTECTLHFDVILGVLVLIQRAYFQKPMHFVGADFLWMVLQFVACFRLSQMQVLENKLGPAKS